MCKSIFFDKPPQSNWYVTWHQDVPINVKKRVETEGFGSWTSKKGVISTRPPEKILHNIYSIRIHLDNTDQQNGVLKVIQKSHFGILSDQEIKSIREEKEEEIIEVNAGGLMIMKPLTLHASEKTQNNQRRRVIHLEFSSLELPGDLEWGEKYVLL